MFPKVKPLPLPIRYTITLSLKHYLNLREYDLFSNQIYAGGIPEFLFIRKKNKLNKLLNFEFKILLVGDGVSNLNNAKKQ